MLKKPKKNLKFISSIAAISLISAVVVGTDKTEVSANPLSGLWARFKNVANSLTISNPFKTSGSANLTKPHSDGKVSKSLWSRFKDFFSSSSSKSSKNNPYGNINPTFELEDISSTTNREEKKQKMLKSLYGDDAVIFTSENRGENLKTTTTKIDDQTTEDKEERRRKLLISLYGDDSKIFVTGNSEDIKNNQNHISRLDKEGVKLKPPVPPKPAHLTVKVDVHTNNNQTSISSSSNGTN